jgi:hypothetical protein
LNVWRTGCLHIAVATAAALATQSGGCLEVDPYLCTSDSACFVDGINGQCDLESQTCVYLSGSCPTHHRDGKGNCVDPPNSSSETGDDDTASTSTTGASTSTTATSAADDDTADTGFSGCAGTQDLTALGVVSVSSLYSPAYPASLSVDGNRTTSWFSAGPEGSGGPSNYAWTLPQTERCISEISIVGNDMHATPEFRQGFGFETVTVRMFNLTGDLVFEQSKGLPGSPDPEVVMMPSISAHRIELALEGHEDPTCGGFSELLVLGSAT